MAVARGPGRLCYSLQSRFRREVEVDVEVDVPWTAYNSLDTKNQRDLPAKGIRRVE